MEWVCIWLRWRSDRALFHPTFSNSAVSCLREPLERVAFGFHRCWWHSWNVCVPRGAHTPLVPVRASGGALQRAAFYRYRVSHLFSRADED